MQFEYHNSVQEKEKDIKYYSWIVNEQQLNAKGMIIPFFIWDPTL